jgi:hypothetical protein
MSLWGNIDYRSSNLKPLFANTTTSSSNSVINGTEANTSKYYGVVAGVSPTEETTSVGSAQHPTHAGWVSLKIGTGPIKSVSVTNGGQGINAAGYLLITDGSVLGQGANANISFTIANSQNSLQAYSSNAFLNAISTVTLVSGGDGFTNATPLTIVTNGANITGPTIAITLGGRAGRISTETLVAMGSITLDDPKDNVYFTGI